MSDASTCFLVSCLLETCYADAQPGSHAVSGRGAMRKTCNDRVRLATALPVLSLICWTFAGSVSAESYDRSTFLQSAQVSDLILYGRWENPRKDTLILDI